MTRSRERIVAAAVVLILAAALGALLVANRRAAQQLANQTYVPKEAKITPEIRLLQEYVRIDTSNPPGNELPGAQWLGRQLAAAGVKYEIIESAPRRATLYARIRGKRPGAGLLLHNHIDVVPAPKSGWEVPPFSGAIRINMLHGRGSIDMKSIAVCELEAFLEVARSGKTPEHDLVFLATADEEEGSLLGIRWLLDHRHDIFDGIQYAITEGGITEMQEEKVSYFGVETGSKQMVMTDLIGPDEASLRRARIGLEPYFKPRDPDRLLPGVRRFFRAVAPQRIEHRERLENVDATIAEGKFWLLPASMRELLQNTVWAHAVQRLPDGRYSMEIAMSNLPDEDPDARLRWLNEKAQALGVKVGEVKRKDGPSPISPEDTPLFARIATEVHRELGADVPVGPEVLAGSTTDARFLRPRGLICYGLQPFPLDFFQSLTVHGWNERVRLDWFMSGVRITKGVVTGYVFETPAGS